MITLQPAADVFDATVSLSPDVYLPLISPISDGIPVRFLFVHVHQP